MKIHTAFYRQEGREIEKNNMSLTSMKWSRTEQKASFPVTDITRTLGT
jgi:hypothetical protein